MIPKILHRVVPQVIPDRFEEFWQGWCDLHPDWVHMTWQDPLDADRWRLGFLFDRCTAGAQLAGLVRLEAVWEHGGVYLDMDVEPVRPLDELLDNRCFFGSEDGIILTDAVFGAERNHPGIGACLQRFIDGFWSPDPSATGPRFTTDTLAGRSDVTVLQKDAFYAYLCDEPHRAGEQFPGSFGVHRWNHSWKDWDQ